MRKTWTLREANILPRILLMPALAAFFLFAGCGGSASWKWIEPERRVHSSSLGLSATLPAHWLMFEDKPTNTLLITRRGIHMDFAQIRRHRLPASLLSTELQLNAQMQSHEAAEIIINNLRSAQGVFDLTVEELAPDVIDGKPCFSLLLSYNMENGMRRRCLIYGIIHENGKYYTEIGLYALDGFYFNAVMDEFLALVGSIKIK